MSVIGNLTMDEMLFAWQAGRSITKFDVISV